MVEIGDKERARLFERFGRTFEAGSAMYAEGDPATHCFLIQTGRVRLRRHVRGRLRAITVLRPGEVFGEEALESNAVRSASALALTDVLALALDRTTFGVLLSSGPEVGLRLVAQLVRRLRRAEEQFDNTMLEDASSRVVHTLMRLSAQGEPTTDGQVVHLSPMDLASRVGLDVDTVKRTVQQLRDEGYLVVHEEKIVLPDVGALTQLYELLGMKEDVREGNERIWCT